MTSRSGIAVCAAGPRWGRAARRPPMLLAQDTNLAWVVGASLDGLGDGFLEHVLAVEMQEPCGLGGHASYVAAEVDPAGVRGRRSSGAAARRRCRARWRVAPGLLLQDAVPVFCGTRSSGDGPTSADARR